MLQVSLSAVATSPFLPQTVSLCCPQRRRSNKKEGVNPACVRLRQVGSSPERQVWTCVLCKCVCARRGHLLQPRLPRCRRRRRLCERHPGRRVVVVLTREGEEGRWFCAREVTADTEPQRGRWHGSTGQLRGRGQNSRGNLDGYTLIQSHFKHCAHHAVPRP